MKKFKIEVQEVLSRVIEVKAKDISDAISKVANRYKKEEIVLDYSDFVDVDFIDLNSPSKNDEKNSLIKEVIEYLYANEKRHFEESDKPENHIFNRLEKLKSLI